ncbi:ABC transporter ATP-binding protein [Tepiditoga spiralis]|uniref:ABC transporter ATP-binding protein n=1 Tax=Tepiditoga spiralis TaxID=2108365 RepID=A0A7G1G1C7_9BACT|nr:ABC transporter ATP-binding protein [Tepiditoga spiralis]BBE29958.1 ABC transporter ATP-binding protein [Tepiditoga spiralis]
MINVIKVNKSFKNNPVLNNITFHVKKGEIFSLIGPNGAGKTTTLRCIYDELTPNSGEIKIMDQHISSKLKEKIAVMPEDRFTFKKFTGTQYLKIWKLLYTNFDLEVFNKFLIHYKFNMEQTIETYSMGMKTLFYLALTIASNADLLILDEPTQNLDPVIRYDILNILKNYAIEKGKTIILSSHEIYELEEISDSFAIVTEGKVLYTDTIDNAKETHRILNKGEKVEGEVISSVNEEILVKTTENIGRYPNFKEISIGYLKQNKTFTPFESTSKKLI